MDKKFALIIGGSGGIGLATAKTLLKQGLTVGITYNTNESELKKELREESIEDYSLYQMNLTNEKSIIGTISKILQEQGKIDVVVHCATAPITNKIIFDLSWEDFQQHLEVQIKGFFTVVKSLSSLILKNHKIKFIAVLTEY